MAAPLADQPTAAPSPKMKAVAGTGIATALVLYVAGQFGLELPLEIAEALVLAGGWLGGYLKRDHRLGPILADVEEIVESGRHRDDDGDGIADH